MRRLAAAAPLALLCLTAQDERAEDRISDAQLQIMLRAFADGAATPTDQSPQISGTAKIVGAGELAEILALARALHDAATERASADPSSEYVWWMRPIELLGGEITVRFDGVIR